MKISNDAQAVITKKDEGVDYFLIIKRFDKEKQSDHYRLVKGGIEQNETSEQAAVREVGEEVGIKEILKSEFLCHYGYTGGEVRHEVDVYLLTISGQSDVSVNSENEGGYTIKNALWMNKIKAIESLNFEDEKKLITQAADKLIH